MMHRGRILILAALLACGVAGHAADEARHEAGAEGVESLSAPLREALGAEMAALQGGLVAVIPAMVAGQWEEVATIAVQMRDSFILKKALTEAQREELHRALPPSFLELDAQFHYLAGMLGHAAEANKPELVGFYLGRMMETCVNCHARHARAKFPAFSDGAASPGHEH